MDHAYFMEKALDQARKALNRHEFPVGCVIVYENEIIATGYRSCTKQNNLNETDHAEMVALRRLASLNIKPKGKGLILYCTLEPCLMCFGAIYLSNVSKIVYAYEDIMGGGTKCEMSSLPPLYNNREILIVPHVLRTKSLSFFKKFFNDSENRYLSKSMLAIYTLNQ